MLSNKIDLGFFPTPLQELKKLSGSFPSYQLFIKRDDHSGLASGGNKTRKLEYLIQDAIDKKCKTVITAGAQQSNHCRQTAAACAIAGLKCHLLLGGEEPSVYEGNLLLSSLLGAQIQFTGVNRKGEDIGYVKNDLERKGQRCYVIPYGGSNSIGALGFVHAMQELKEQLRAIERNMDYIFFASSSGGTQAGMILGKELAGIEAQLMPINIDKEDMGGKRLEKIVWELVTEGAQLLAMNKDYRLEDIFLNRDYDKDGYGVLTEKEKFAIKTLAQKEGILLDPVYTGRAFYAMLDMLKDKKINPGSNVLFWHTGGFPALFDQDKKF